MAQIGCQVPDTYMLSLYVTNRDYLLFKRIFFMLPLISNTLEKLKTMESLPIFVIRVMLGMFFAASGWGKLFTEQGRHQMLNIVTQSGIPFPELNAVFASVTELVGGILLAIGLLTIISAFMLANVMVVALITNFISDMPTDSLLSASNYFVYTSEFLYVLIFAWLIFAGPGKVSLDYMLMKKMRTNHS